MSIKHGWEKNERAGNIKRGKIRLRLKAGA